MNELTEDVQPIGRLGKMHAKSSMKALHLSDFTIDKKKTIAIPPATDFWLKRKSFPLRTFGNTEYGSCTRSKQAIAAMRMERLETRQTPLITDEEIIRVYTNMSSRLYGGGDNGAYEADSLSEWRKPDLTFRDTKGRPLTIDAYLRINHADINAIKESLFLSGAHGIAVCFSLPYAWSKFKSPLVWDLPIGQSMIGEYAPWTWGGHSMWATDFSEEGIYVEHTWGLPRQLITWRGFAAYCDESYLVIDSINSWKKQSKSKLVDLDAIKEAVNSVSDQKIK